MAKYYSTTELDNILSKEAEEQANSDHFLDEQENSRNDNFTDFWDFQYQQHMNQSSDDDDDDDCDFDPDDYGDPNDDSCAEESPTDEQTTADDYPENNADSDGDDEFEPEAPEKGVTRKRHFRKLNKAGTKKSVLLYVVAHEKCESTKRLLQLRKEFSKLEGKFYRLEAGLCSLDAEENCDMIALKYFSQKLEAVSIRLDEMKNEINTISSAIEFYDRALESQHINELLSAFNRIKRKKAA